MTTQEHKEQKLKELSELPIAQDFEIPNGLLIPFANKLLVKKVYQPSRKSAGGIIIPESGDTKHSTHGIIYGIGVGVDLEQYPVKLGMKVEFTIGLDEDTYHEGEAYMCIDQFHIKGAVPEGNYKHPYFPTNREKRRQEMIDNTKRARDISNAKIDEIQNS